MDWSLYACIVFTVDAFNPWKYPWKDFLQYGCDKALFPTFSGFLSGTSVYSRMNGGCQKQQSLEPPRGCGTVMKLPYGCSFLPENSQPMSSIHGSRGIHVTRTLSESTRGVVSNRPLSPHLPVKKPQLRATFSISHRIFGASLASAILLIPIAWKFSLLLDV